MPGPVAITTNANPVSGLAAANYTFSDDANYLLISVDSSQNHPGALVAVQDGLECVTLEMGSTSMKLPLVLPVLLDVRNFAAGVGNRKFDILGPSANSYYVSAWTSPPLTMPVLGMAVTS